jgi:hypothetical protein
MYAPELRGNSAELKLRIEERGATGETAALSANDER